jgi:hypothetical protein
METIRKNIWSCLIAVVVMIVLGLLYNAAQSQQHLYQPPEKGYELFTDAKPWKLFRTAGAEDGAAGYALSSTDLCFATIVGGGSIVAADVAAHIEATNGLIDVWNTLGWGTNQVTIAFFSVDDAANDTFDFELYAWADASPYGPAIPVYATTGNACIVGTYDCVKHPITGTAQAGGQWVDTIAGTDMWPSSVIVTDSGNNRLCTMTFDLRGCRYLLLRVFDAGGGVTEAAKIGAIITGL